MSISLKGDITSVDQECSEEIEVVFADAHVEIYGGSFRTIIGIETDGSIRLYGWPSGSKDDDPSINVVLDDGTNNP